MAASPLTKARAGSVRAVNQDKRPLAAVAVWKGGLAAVNVAGFMVAASGDPDEVVVGRFLESVDNSGGAAGDKNVNVEYFRERNLFLLDNDSGAPCVVANRERPVTCLDDHTATLFDNSKGAELLCYDVTSEGVWVEFMFPASPDDSNLPRIQRGRTTLVAGTKTVTGVKLTATSRIFCQIADPGAGAITGFGALVTPDATRNVGAGSFVITAVDDAKALINTVVATVDYLIIG